MALLLCCALAQDPAAILRDLRDFSPAGMDRRLGPAASGAPKVPEIWMPPVQEGAKGRRFGMGPDGKAEFESGGILEFPGSPFCVSATNVN